MKKKTFEVDGRTVSVYPCEQENAPIVFSSDFGKNAKMVLAACKSLEVPEFHLVSITDLRWDEDLSPWESEPIVTKEDHFTGEANVYLELLETVIVPKVEELLPNHGSLVLNGYSMGGLFALYAVHNSTCFDGYAAPSGSVWYPDLVSYAKEQGFVRKPKAIYLSIGDKESKTKNPYLSQTQSNMEALKEIYEEKGVSTTFELNKGNHYQGATTRIAKGIGWVLKELG